MVRTISRRVCACVHLPGAGLVPRFAASQHILPPPLKHAHLKFAHGSDKLPNSANLLKKQQARARVHTHTYTCTHTHAQFPLTCAQSGAHETGDDERRRRTQAERCVCVSVCVVCLFVRERLCSCLRTNSR